MSNIIIMNSVDSSNIDSMGYDTETATMEVKFKNGGRYRYKRVPLETYLALNESPSKGAFLAAHISRKFEHEKLPEEKEEKLENNASLLAK